MVWRSLSDIALSDTKQLLVGCREQLRKKHTEFDSKVSHLMKSMKSKKLLLFWSVKKSFSLRNLTKISNLIRVGVKQVTCLFEDWKKLSVWGNVLLRARFRDRWKESIYKTDGTKRACPSQQDFRFRAWPINVDFTHCLMIIYEYLGLSQKPA